MALNRHGEFVQVEEKGCFLAFLGNFKKEKQIEKPGFFLHF
jgi:hypothetical protein